MLADIGGEITIEHLAHGQVGRRRRCWCLGIDAYPNLIE
jgi:hypothetical protein